MTEVMSGSGSHSYPGSTTTNMLSNANTILEDSTTSLPSQYVLRRRSPPRKAATSLFSRTYKQASNYFLTRQLLDCYRCLEPLIARIPEGALGNKSTPVVASIATAPRVTRVKIWNLYLTLLNAVVELGPEEGKAQFGITEWSKLVSKAREGTIWDEVVQSGYEGHEGYVDAEIVANLITLLLAQSPNQIYNQHKIEEYLAALNKPNLDISSRLETMNSSTTSFLRPSQSGANTPRDLNCRVKILELFSLHVLPRNEEWQYAKEFISMSEVLDEDRKEAFLQTLQALQEQNQADKDEVSKLTKPAPELERQQPPNELLEHQEVSIHRKQPTIDTPIPSAQLRHEDSRTAETEEEITTPKSSLRNSPNSTKLSGVRPPRPKSAANQASHKGLPGLFHTAQSLVKYIADLVARNPALLSRFLLFVIALLLALAKREVRARLDKLTRGTWSKVKQTIGMGVKVSYI